VHSIPRNKCTPIAFSGKSVGAQPHELPVTAEVKDSKGVFQSIADYHGNALTISLPALRTPQTGI
jgi:hypothetical protein